MDWRPILAFLQTSTKAFAWAGVPMVLGTDEVGVPGVVPGFSIHGELRLLYDAGISPFEVLASGTRNAGTYLAEHMGAVAFGTVTSGSRADLVLLDRDPRSHRSVFRDPVGVTVAGQRYPRSWLHAEMEALRAR